MPPNTNNEDIWFEVNKNPLKWQIPFGVLIDNLLNVNYEVPITIIAHFRNFPDNILIRFKNIDNLKFQYMNALKEANTVKFQSSKDILNLGTNETLKLVDIVLNDGFKLYREYWEINKIFLDNSLNSIK